MKKTLYLTNWYFAENTERQFYCLSVFSLRNMHILITSFGCGHKYWR